MRWTAAISCTRVKSPATDCYAEFSSIIGTGHAEIVAGDEEKIQGLQSLMKQAAGKENCEFRPEMLAAVCVFRLEIDKLSCKVHL